MRILPLLLSSSLLAALGQLAFKLALTPGNPMLPMFVLGVAGYGIGTVLWFMVLSRDTHLSWAYGMGGSGYIFTVILAALVLNENVPLVRWIGVATIFIGVVVVGSS